MNTEQLLSLIEAVEAVSTGKDMYLHGSQHWRCVSLLGIQLARQTPGGDALVAFLFGLFHDSMRENEEEDFGHGLRGAALLRKMAEEDRVPISPAQLEHVLYACETHTIAPPTEVMPVGVCYDADRLTLWRVWITPSEKYLSTELGKEMARTQATLKMHDEPLEWVEVVQALVTSAPPPNPLSLTRGKGLGGGGATLPLQRRDESVDLFLRPLLGDTE